MVKNTIILLVLYFLQFNISSLWRKENISPNLTNSKEPEQEKISRFPSPMQLKVHVIVVEPVHCNDGSSTFFFF